MVLWNGTNDAIPGRWFRCDRNAIDFPGSHILGSTVWRTDREDLPGPLGERLAPVAWEPGPNTQGYFGIGHCGSVEAFRNGGIPGYDPPILTDAQGRAPCCPRPHQIGTGGIRFGQRGPATRAGIGGFRVGGVGAFPLHPAHLGAGGFRVGGVGGIYPELAQVGLGGFRVGGLASQCADPILTESADGILDEVGNLLWVE